MLHVVMAVNLVVKVYLAALFVSGVRVGASSYHTQDKNFKRLAEKEVGNGTLQDTLSKCDNTSSLSNVTACSFTLDLL